MRLLLLKCGICSAWYKPSAHSGHCFNCGSMPLQVAPRKLRYFHITDALAIEVVRGVPVYSNSNMRSMARVLSSE